VPLKAAYAKLGGDSRTGGSTYYRDPEILRRESIPGGGTLRLEVLRPFGEGEPIVRWVAEYEAGGSHNTTESYLQIPHHGYDALEQPDAARLIEEDCRRLIRAIRRERAQAGRGEMPHP